MPSTHISNLVYLVRHGETEWSVTGQHTGVVDLPLTDNGEREAKRLVGRFTGVDFKAVYVSPLRRARQTCELAGFSDAKIDPDLAEWNYGDYEGKTTKEIHLERPNWNPFDDGFPGGESVEQVGARADRVVQRLHSAQGNLLIFAHGHFLRFLAARWLGLPPGNARFFVLGTTAVSILGYENNITRPAILLWNDRHHLQR